MIVLQKIIFDIPVDEIAGVKLARTLLGGKIVYDHNKE